MDFVTKSLAQLSELFRSMTVGARITAGLLLVLVVVSVTYLFRYQTYGGGVYLMNGETFTQSQINTMEAAFSQANLNGWENDGNRIRVPRSQKAAFMAALAEKGALPRNFLEILEKSVSQTNIWDDRQTREARLKVAKQQELSAIIGAMRGIQVAAVLWDSEKASSGASILKQVINTASVSVKPLGSTELTGNLVSAIRNLVSSSIAGLKPDNVVVTDLNTGRAYRGDGENGGDPGSGDPYTTRKQWHEQQYTTKILQALSYVPRVSVVASVELDKEKHHKQMKVVHDPKTVPMQVIDKSRARSHDGAAPGGRAGFTANQPQAIQPVTSTKGPHEEEDESERTEYNAISSETLERDRVGLTPTRVTVSVQVPSSYFLKVWQERNPVQPGTPAKPPAAADLELVRTQEVAKIEKCIAPLLPPLENLNPTTPDTTKLVTVTEFQDITPETIPLPDMKDNVLQWLQQHWTTLGMVLLGAISLSMLRSMARSGPASAETPARPTPAAAAAAATAAAAAAVAEAEAESIAERRLRRLSGGGPSLRDELSEIVKEDPDAAANILKLWIGNAT